MGCRNAQRASKNLETTDCAWSRLVRRCPHWNARLLRRQLSRVSKPTQSPRFNTTLHFNYYYTQHNHKHDVQQAVIKVTPLSNLMPYKNKCCAKPLSKLFFTLPELTSVRASLVIQCTHDICVDCLVSSVTYVRIQATLPLRAKWGKTVLSTQWLLLIKNSIKTLDLTLLKHQNLPEVNVCLI